MFNADTTFFDNQDFSLSASNLTGKSFHENQLLWIILLYLIFCTSAVKGVDKMALSHETFSTFIFPPLFILTLLVTIESEWHVDPYSILATRCSLAIWEEGWKNPLSHSLQVLLSLYAMPVVIAYFYQVAWYPRLWVGICWLRPIDNF